MLRKPTIVSVENIRTRVVELFTAHDPGQVEHVDELMKKWKGKENDLLKSLCEKYNQPFTKMKVVGIKEQYTIGSKLGSGGFAMVRKCKDKTTNTLYALKIINKKI